MRRLITIIILCIGIFMNADAQTFTQRIQKPVAGQGTVTIHQDSVIDRLVNNATLGIKSASAPAKPATQKPASQPGSASQSSQTGSTSLTSSSSLSSSVDTVDTSKKVIRGGYKVAGYRVQAFAGGNSRADRIKAEQTGNNIKAQFSSISGSRSLGTLLSNTASFRYCFNMPTSLEGCKWNISMISLPSITGCNNRL